MTVTLDLVLMILALICFAVAAFWQPATPRFNLVAAGLFFWALTSVV